MRRVSPISDTPDPDPLHETPNLRSLRLLVTAMIGGVLVILALLVIRYQTSRAPLPKVIILPDGPTATACTQGADGCAVVTADTEILTFDRGATGRRRQTLQIDPN